MSRKHLHRPPPEYYRHIRHQIIELIDPTPDKVLEVGCGAGNTLAYLKKLGSKETFGIELDPQAADEAREKVDHLLVGDVEQLDLSYQKEIFDCIIFGDILEHLRDPWRVLERVTVFLKHGGQVVASIPNVRFYGTSLKLVFAGRWDYREEGILDRTHLRFFTRRSMVELFEEANLKVLSVGSHYGPKRSIFNWLTLRIFKDLLAIQHFIKAVKE